MNVDRHRAGIAAALSAVLPGAGQWYSRRRGAALLFGLPFLFGALIVAMLARRGVVGLAEIFVQPRWLWLLVAGNGVLTVLRVVSVIDAWRFERRTRGGSAAWTTALVVLLVTVTAVPHVFVHERAVQAIDFLEDTFDPEPVAPLPQREEDLLAAGVDPVDLGPTLTTAADADPAPNTTAGVPEGPPRALPAPATTTTFPIPLGPDDLAAALHARLVRQLAEAAAAATPDPIPAVPPGERITILLAGGDFGPGRNDLRTDVMIVATFDLRAGTAALIGVSRDLSQVPLPAAWSQFTTMLQVQQWHEDRAYQEVVEAAEAAGEEAPPAPEFVPCNCFADRLNYLHVLTADWVRTFPEAPDPGMEALRQTLELLLGIPIDYYALVDFAGFVELVDALGGIDVRVTETMDVAFSPAFEGEDPVSVTVTPGVHHFDGRTALAYVRNRTGSSDVVRMRRQRCMLRDLAGEADPVTLLAQFPAIAAAIRESTTTTIPLDVLPDLIEAAGSLDAGDIATLAVTGAYASETNYMGLPIVRTPWVRAAVSELLDGLAEGDVGTAAADECG